MRLTYKYRLRPNAAQRKALDETLDRCRELYNAGLQEKRDAYLRCGLSRSRNAQMGELTEIKALRPEYNDIYAQVLQNVFARLHFAFDCFFRRVKERKGGRKPGYPRFKSANQYNSFTFPQVSRKMRKLIPQPLTGGGVSFSGNRLIVHGIPGPLKIILHRQWKGLPKTATFKREGGEGGQWYILFSCDEVPEKPRELTGHIAGVDMGLESFATLDDGTSVPNPRLYQRAESGIIKARRRLDRRILGSNRRKKAKVLFSKRSQKVTNARRDFHHKVARTLIQKFDAIGVENLDIMEMSYDKRLTKLITDVGWGNFIRILVSKAESAGCEVVKVDPAGTSQECASCGAVAQKNLSVRLHDCPCGFKTHRDTNAALNIRSRAFGSRPGSGLRGGWALDRSKDWEMLAVDPRSPRAS